MGEAGAGRRAAAGASAAGRRGGGTAGASVPEKVCSEQAALTLVLYDALGLAAGKLIDLTFLRMLHMCTCICTYRHTCAHVCVYMYVCV